MTRRALAVALLTLSLLVGWTAHAQAGAYRYCVNTWIVISSSPMKICLPLGYDK